MFQLRPNNTFKFTICGNFKMEMREPPPMIRDRRPRERWTMPIMLDNSIFFEHINIGKAIFLPMAKAICDGTFKDGLQRFEIKVNDPSEGPANYYKVRPLDWESLPSPSYEREPECEGCRCCQLT